MKRRYTRGSSESSTRCRNCKASRSWIAPDIRWSLRALRRCRRSWTSPIATILKCQPPAMAAPMSVTCMRRAWAASAPISSRCRNRDPPTTGNSMASSQSRCCRVISNHSTPAWAAAMAAISPWRGPTVAFWRATRCPKTAASSSMSAVHFTLALRAGWSGASIRSMRSSTTSTGASATASSPDSRSMCSPAWKNLRSRLNGSAI